MSEFMGSSGPGLRRPGDEVSGELLRHVAEIGPGGDPVPLAESLAFVLRTDAEGDVFRHWFLGAGEVGARALLAIEPGTWVTLRRNDDGTADVVLAP